ncbi:hybrid sensor histidine kinase/response regulator [Lyngbya confervoides]|uniref:histidine kinase n=1 Tax=Lyngbya confervoides BDU141951 TaxID=1574623 RepID=A0ABD4T5W0_9CYAN|nr:ATP-binding protein [Lyngbya confervoides]MCM1983873.1 ATP-binding protein [Lyngbya confervoides BDU141951]
MANFERWVPRSCLDQLLTQVLDLAASASAEVLFSPNQACALALQVGTFCAVIAPDLVILMQVQAQSPDQLLQVQVYLDPEEVGQVLSQLQPGQADLQAQIHRLLPQIQSPSQVISSSVQGFLYSLLDWGMQAYTAAAPTLATCQPMVDAALTQQLAQEGLIHRVTNQIRQSLELPEILATAAHQVRQILGVERLVIYQFQTLDPGLLDDRAWDKATQSGASLGSVTYESRADEDLISALEFQESYCWNPTSQSIQKFQRGKVLSIGDVQHRYQDFPCMQAFLQQLQVQSKVAVPILVKSQLWGLLIAHQCSYPRTWQPSDITFLEQISEHLSVAIAQAQLYHQLHKQKETLENQVQQRTQELQEALVVVQAANQAKSEFLATMSHELRTPLTCVIGMSATLLRWSLGPLTDKQRSYLQTIHDSGEHLLELINDILDLSHLEAGKGSLRMGLFSISSLAHQSLQMLRDSAQSSGITLKAQINLSAGRDRFTADARRVKQILFNLLSNSIKFTPAGGSVTLRVWRVEESVTFQVEDTGIGIAEAQQPLLFQKFQQLDTSYHRSYEGVGLGLALVKQFVDMHHGSIEVQSTEGQGSIFTVTLPDQTPRLPHAAPAPRLSPAQESSRILLIENQDESAGLICDILTAAGYQLIWMIEGATAFPQVKILQPLVVILDIQPSLEHCLRLIQQIRQDPAIAQTKLLVLIPEDLTAAPHPFLNAGADAYLEKPILPEQLLHTLDRLLSPVSA